MNIRLLWVLLLVTFSTGVRSSGIARQTVATPPSTVSVIQPWNDTEDDTRRRMSEFQRRLEQLEKQPTPDNADRLAKEMEVQRGIDDVLIKYREAQQAKFTPFAAAGVSLLGAFLSLIGTVFGWRRGKSSPSA